MIPNMKNTKKQRRSTFPNIGRVSNSSITRILGCKWKAKILEDHNIYLPHAWYSVDCLQRSEDPDSSDGWQVRFLHIHQILQCSRDHNEAVQLVPGLLEIAASAHHPHGNHLDEHLPSKVDINQTISYLDNKLLIDVQCWMVTLRAQHFLLHTSVSAQGL